MTDKYEETCWSCGSNDLEHKDSYFLCRQCGATYNYVSKPGPAIVVPGNVFKDDDTTKPTRRSRHPTSASTNAARKAREA